MGAEPDGLAGGGPRSSVTVVAADGRDCRPRARAVASTVAWHGGGRAALRDRRHEGAASPASFWPRLFDDAGGALAEGSTPSRTLLKSAYDSLYLTCLSLRTLSAWKLASSI